MGGQARSQFVPRLLTLSSTPEPRGEQNSTPLRYVPADCAKICPVVKVSGYLGKVHPCTGTEALYRPYGP
jgi:hypothetical protein